MNILFTRFPYESSYGGAEVQTLSLLKGLRQKGHNVQFLGSCNIIEKLCHEAGIRADNLNIGKPPVTKLCAVNFLWRKRLMKNAIIKEINARQSDAGIDAIFMLSLSEKLLLTQEFSNSNTKLFWIEHDRPGRWLTKNPWLKQLLLLSKRVTTVAVSNMSKKQYEHIGWDDKKIVVIPNGVARQTAKTFKSDPSDTDLLIGCIARLSYDKGVDLLIDAVKNLDGVRLEILGQGNCEQNIRKKIKEANSSAHTGKTDMEYKISLTAFEKNIDEFYSRIDILVLPSRKHDPFGLVAAEAMIRGIPVIITDVCGIASHIKHKRDAFVVAAGSSKAIGDAISLLRNNELRTKLAISGKKCAEHEFTIDKMVDRYDKLIS